MPTCQCQGLQGIRRLCEGQGSGKMNYGTGGVGATSPLHLPVPRFAATGVKPTHVPFRGSGPALNALARRTGRFMSATRPSASCRADQVGQVKVSCVATTPSGSQSCPMCRPRANRACRISRLRLARDVRAQRYTRDYRARSLQPRVKRRSRTKRYDRSASHARHYILPTEAGTHAGMLGQHVAQEIDKWAPVIKKAGVTAPRSDPFGSRESARRKNPAPQPFCISFDRHAG